MIPSLAVHNSSYFYIMETILLLKQLLYLILLLNRIENGKGDLYQTKSAGNEFEHHPIKDFKNEIPLVSYSFPSSRELPPNAITDLRLTSIGSIAPYDLVSNLKWFAPASSPETPNTKVETYDVKYCESQDILLSYFDSCPNVLLTNGLQTVLPGEEMNADIILPLGLLTQYFIAVRPVGATGLKGDLSNVVYTVIMPTEPTPESTTTGTTIFLVYLPPEKISDLRQESLTGPEPSHLYNRLTWTAPSASPETPEEPVKTYEIRYSQTEQELIEQFDSCLNVQLANNATFQSVPPGEPMTIDVFIDSGYNENFLIAIRAIGTYGAKGEVSNIVQTQTTIPTLPTGSPSSPDTLSAGVIIGISLGGAAIISIITILIVCIYLNKKSKNKNSLVKEPSNKGKNNGQLGGYYFPQAPPFIPRPDYDQPTRPPPPPRKNPKNPKKYQQY